MKKKGRSPAPRVTLPSFICGEVRGKVARANSMRKAKSFLSSRLRRIRPPGYGGLADGGGGGGKGREGERERGGLNAEKVSVEISFATGVQSARLVISVFVLMEWNSSAAPRWPRFSLKQRGNKVIKSRRAFSLSLSLSLSVFLVSNVSNARAIFRAPLNARLTRG